MVIIVLSVILNGVSIKLAIVSKVIGNDVYRIKGRNLFFGSILRREFNIMSVFISVNVVKNFEIKKIMSL